MPGVVLVTGSSGLVGSECVRHFDRLGWRVYGLDNNARKDFFGSDGDTTANRERLQAETRYTHIKGDVRESFLLVKDIEPELVIHCAGQPSHDLATQRPLMDFAVNADGTMQLLEAVRQHAPDAAFCFASTNKVYGDAPNDKPLTERPTRWAFANDADVKGIDEELRIDRSRHSIFGASKLAADVMVQEYARTFGLQTGVFRLGCVTGGAHAAAELHGFLAYMARCCREGRKYRVYGYKGKQVRDNLHAADVARAFEEFAKAPRPGEVYNLGGGFANSVSVVEAIELTERRMGKRLEWEYVDEPRGGDHVCYYSDCSKFRSHFPQWSVTRPLESIVDELCKSPRSVAA